MPNRILNGSLYVAILVILNCCAVRAADDGSRRIEWRCGAKVDDEPYVFAGALPLDLGSGFDTEEGVAFGIRDARSG